MKNSTRFLTLMTLVIASLFLFGTAYAGNDEAPRTGFVDLDGDGFNDNKNLSSGDGEGSANQNANANAFKYAEQLKKVHEIKHELFDERKAEFKGDVLEEHGSWGDSGEANLNPVWSEVSGPDEIIGHKGGK